MCMCIFMLFSINIINSCIKQISLYIPPDSYLKALFIKLYHIAGWWACHQGCNDYRGWRVLKEEVPRIPLAFCFANWGLRDVWLEQIREKRKQG